jgi:hypothetical protein
MKRNVFVIAVLLQVLLFQNLLSQGCMESTSESGKGISVMGYIQPQAEYTFLGNDIRGESLDEMGFYLHLARIGLIGHIPHDFSFNAMVELTPSIDGPFLLTAFISYNRWAPYAKITIGQFKVPFGLELSTGCHKLHTVNRSEVVGQLAGPWRDMGIMVAGGTGGKSLFGSKTENFFGYSLALTNGTGVNTFDNNRKKDFIGRLTFHPFEFITLGASYRTGKHPTEIEDSDDDHRSRFGVDLELKYKDFTIQGEFIDGSDKGSYTTGGGCHEPLKVIQGSVARNGFFIQGMYMTKWDLQPVIKWDLYDPNTSEELGLNDQQSVITYGLNYFFNERTRLQINYLYKAEENALVEVPNDALLVQLQVTF